MNPCPFCGFDEGWPRESPWNLIERRDKNNIRYVIQCHVCGAIGPESKTVEGAERKWNGYIKDEIDISDKGALNLALDEQIGVPIATLTNTPGMGNAQPASIAAMTGSQQQSSSSIGSGDKWGSTTIKKRKRKVYRKRKRTNEEFYPSLEEESINPYDKIGTAMAKKMKVPLYFEKGKNQSIKHITQKNVEKPSDKRK